MQTTGPSVSQGDGRLWAIALALSLLANIALLAIAGLTATKTRRDASARPLPEPVVAVAVIFPEMAPAIPPAPAPPSQDKPRFARTSADQASAPPESAAFIGERDTTATSDRAADKSAPPLPSQKGLTPKDPDDLETTESDYREGALAEDSPPAPAQPEVAESTPAPPQPERATAEKSTPASSPAREELLQGPNPVDVEVATDTPTVKSTPVQETAVAEAPKPSAAKPADDPSFRGFQRKNAIVGSISRTGRSALNVEATPLGRYQAAISRAVELEWQRNCARHRDFITPGFLTVRFFVEPTGKVRTVQFVGEMTTGEVQKGFTLSSIRDAEIPAMPAPLKKEFAKEPLELIFNFYF